eukprot:750133_1
MHRHQLLALNERWMVGYDDTADDPNLIDLSLAILQSDHNWIPHMQHGVLKHRWYILSKAKQARKAEEWPANRITSLRKTFDYRNKATVDGPFIRPGSEAEYKADDQYPGSKKIGKYYFCPKLVDFDAKAHHVVCSITAEPDDYQLWQHESNDVYKLIDIHTPAFYKLNSIKMAARWMVLNYDNGYQYGIHERYPPEIIHISRSSLQSMKPNDYKQLALVMNPPDPARCDQFQTLVEQMGYTNNDLDP